MIEKRFTNVILLLAAIVLFMACGDRKVARKAKYFYQANDHLEDRDYKQAIEFYSEAILLDENFKDAYNNRGIARFHQGKYFDAINDYSKAIQIDSGYIDAFYNRANAYIANEKWQRGLKDMMIVSAAYPDSSYVYFNLGILYHQLHQNAEALKALNKAIILDSQNVESYINRATVYYHLRNWEAAKADLNLVLENDGKQPNAHNVMGLIYIKEKLYDLATNAFDKALDLEPNNPFYLNNRGLALIFQNKMEAAELDINNSIKLKPDNAWANRNKGIFYHFNNDQQNAIRMLKQAKSQLENLESIDYFLGLAYLADRQPDKACIHFKEGSRNGDIQAITALQEHCASY